MILFHYTDLLVIQIHLVAMLIHIVNFFEELRVHGNGVAVLREHGHHFFSKCQQFIVAVTLEDVEEHAADAAQSFT